MGYRIVTGVILLGLLGACQTAPKPGAPKARAASGLMPSGQAFKPFPVYTDRPPRRGHYTPSGYMGDSDLSMSGAYIQTPTAEGPCLKVVYKPKGPKGWAGINWQDPANNWGDVGDRAGYDLRGATKLTFWARGLNGGEKIHEFRMGGTVGQFPDSDAASISSVRLTKEWKQYTIDLAGKDLRHIIAGFGFGVIKAENPGGATFFLDDIYYEGLEPLPVTRSTSLVASAKIPEAPVPEPSAPIKPAVVVPVPVVPVKPAVPMQEAPELEKADKSLRSSFSSQVRFASGQASLDENNRKVLDQIVSLLSTYSSNQVLIDGHTDNLESAGPQLNLSQLRAEAVRDYLIKQGGFPMSRFKVMGYGATRPVDSNNTKAGRSLNRRVEVTILKTGAEQ